MDTNTEKKGLTDVAELRRRARENVNKGPMTDGYRANREMVIKLLNDALATELVCVLRYRCHYYMAQGINSEPVAMEFLEHSMQELDHADKIALRIVQLGGQPNLNPDSLSGRSHAEYKEVKGLDAMIRENLIAERIAVDSYREMITYIGNDDPTTRRMLEDILAVEEEHAEDLSSLLDK
ncbi:MAG TPA: ferritin-like domain-containing protein [Planktothrix sp.]|jgi:bacterioferritin